MTDHSGNVVARYAYDAWGNHKVLNPDGTENTSAGFIGNINPIRYRGYYFDKDLGLYWLQTRFYDPETGRFLSPDSVEYVDLGKRSAIVFCFVERTGIFGPLFFLLIFRENRKLRFSLFYYLPIKNRIYIRETIKIKRDSIALMEKRVIMNQTESVGNENAKGRRRCVK